MSRWTENSLSFKQDSTQFSVTISANLHKLCSFERSFIQFICDILLGGVSPIIVAKSFTVSMWKLALFEHSNCFLMKVSQFVGLKFHVHYLQIRSKLASCLPFFGKPKFNACFRYEWSFCVCENVLKWGFVLWIGTTQGKKSIFGRF